MCVFTFFFCSLGGCFFFFRVEGFFCLRCCFGFFFSGFEFVIKVKKIRGRIVVLFYKMSGLGVFRRFRVSVLNVGEEREGGSGEGREDERRERV